MLSRYLAALSLLISVTPPLTAQDTTAGPVVKEEAQGRACICPAPNPGFAAGEVVFVNVAVNLFDRAFHPEGEQFHVTLSSVWDNIKHSWTWDDNNFKTNQFSHPYHGSTYYNSGRSNGLSYWESAPLAAMGSVMWEFAGEKNPASLNDFVATTFGGIALGEMLHRGATLIRNNEASGGGRFWREIAALPLDPVGTFNRFIRGDYKRVGGNPPEREPDLLRMRFDGGYLAFTGDTPLGEATDGAFVSYNMDYGDAFKQGDVRPFDIMRLRAEATTRDSGFISRLQGEGVLIKFPMAAENHRLFLEQRFDYISNSAYLYGGQSLEGRLVSRFRFSDQFRAYTGLGVTAVLVGAVNSEFVDLPQRNYDFGPGLGFSLTGVLQGPWQSQLSVSYLGLSIFTLAGDAGTHLLNAGSVDLRVGVMRNVGIGGRFAFYRRDSHYPNDVHTKQDSPEFRAYASWNIL